MGKSFKLISSIAICLLIGSLGSFFTASAVTTWYAYLVKPPFSPPSFIFAPVWTVLYVLMGISFYLIWDKKINGNRKIDTAIKLFWTQLALNAIWSPIFFGAKKLFLAFLVIVLMWFFIRKTIIAFGKIDKKASRLLYPYLAWVSFAVILNFSVWLLNI